MKQFEKNLKKHLRAKKMMLDFWSACGAQVVAKTYKENENQKYLVPTLVEIEVTIGDDVLVFDCRYQASFNGKRFKGGSLWWLLFKSHERIQQDIFSDVFGGCDKRIEFETLILTDEDVKRWADLRKCPVPSGVFI
jgi:hypothetical protein